MCIRDRALTANPIDVGRNRRRSSNAYSRSTNVDRMEAYVDGRPMPRASSSRTSVASEYRALGSVKCCSARILLSETFSPSISEGRTVFYSLSSSSFPSWYTFIKPGSTTRDPVALKTSWSLDWIENCTVTWRRVAGIIWLATARCHTSS